MASFGRQTSIAHEERDGSEMGWGVSAWPIVAREATWLSDGAPGGRALTPTIQATGMGSGQTSAPSLTMTGAAGGGERLEGCESPEIGG